MLVMRVQSFIGVIIVIENFSLVNINIVVVYLSLSLSNFPYKEQDVSL